MAIAELASYRRFELKEYHCPPPAPGEVQVRVEAVGICGSDLHHFVDGHIGDVETVYPTVLGHEPTGTVTALGEGVTGWAPGDRVACEPPIYCYHCEWCMAGRHNLCEHVRFMSNPGVPGFFRDHVTLPAVNLLPLPKNLSFVEGSLYEPVSIILHSFRFAEPRLGETAVVFGAGPIGLCTIAALRLAGVARIFSIEPVAHRRALAVDLGADVAIDPNETDPVKEILQATGSRGADVTLDCATQAGTINQSLYVTKSGGRVVITVRRANQTGGAALRMLEEHVRRFAPMITHCRPMTEVQAAFETLANYGDGVGKVVLNPV
jgi:L-iditol 2-dehydrogenase